MTTKPDKNICGARMKQARLAKGWTQTDLGKALDKSCPICRASITKIELGTRQVCDYELVELAKALEVETDWLLTGARP
jgi:transcriptional regulator with XRE-family HTH domain